MTLANQKVNPLRINIQALAVNPLRNQGLELAKRKRRNAPERIKEKNKREKGIENKKSVLSPEGKKVKIKNS